MAAGPSSSTLRGRGVTVALVSGVLVLMAAAWMHHRGRGIAIPDVLPVRGREGFAWLGMLAGAYCLLQMTPAFILLGWLETRAARTSGGAS